MKFESPSQIIVRASFSSYIVLGGVWVLLAVSYLLLSIKNPVGGFEKGAFIAGLIALLFWVWLFGFKISLSKQVLKYRDGFFHSSSIALSEIVQFKDSNIDWYILGVRIRVPCILVISKDDNVLISINSKPFKMSDLKKIRGSIR